MIYDKGALNNGLTFKYACDILTAKMQDGTLNMLQSSNGAGGKAKLAAALFVPIVVNSAFACELFIKSMLPTNTTGHKLNQLFNLLDSDVQEKIKNTTIDNIKKTTPSYCRQSFQDDLDNNSNIFAEWRYFHEKNNCSANLQFMSAFMNSIYDIAYNENKTST
ncbi:MAG: hypothetical protein IKK42_03650 [Oscillospiraceae bacterium]|nr:hypothetical protein [Oscillospiraceae bacterium]